MGVRYKTNITWDKLEAYGRGSYVRTVHEHLLIGVRPQTPTHFLDNDVLSMIRERRSRRNSEKPAIVMRWCSARPQVPTSNFSPDVASLVGIVTAISLHPPPRISNWRLSN